MIKKILLIVAFLVLVFAAILATTYGGLVLHHNVGGGAIESKRASEGLERATQWLLSNQQTILEQNNPMLWWMVKRSFETTNDFRLGRLYGLYKKRYLDRRYHNYWRMLFEPQHIAMIPVEQVSQLPDYNQYFVYGLSCNQQLEATEVIQRQLDTDFCDRYHPISPACVTHQMMGLYFRQRQGCGDPEDLARQMRFLQDKVHRQLTWDPRVVDVFIQRLLMLVDTGAADSVKNRWLARLLDAQLDDGGWSGFRPLIPVGANRYLGFHAKGITLRAAPESDFHATAQGVLLLSLLTSQNAAAE